MVSRGHRYVLNTEDHLLLVQKSSYYVFPSINDCIEDNSLLLCPYIGPMLNSPSDHCLSQLILGLSPTLCSFSQLLTLEIYYHQIEGTWLISILNETLGKLECSSQSRNGPSYQKFSGIIVLPPGCTFSTGSLSLFSHQVSRSSLQDAGFPIFLRMLNLTDSSSLISADEAILADLKTSMGNLKTLGVNNSLDKVLVSLMTSARAVDKKGIIGYILVVIALACSISLLYYSCTRFSGPSPNPPSVAFVRSNQAYIPVPG